ncbi:MAG TPA: 30S ribosomal protein S12 methylthiotransferase RimO, partial [Flavobacteriales bacterium]|nr:30S ribosomal protein S12 methylthiotransferase RimO [Flavobacteriales bacterium]
HQQMLEWVGQSRFDRLGVFTYSHEENTGAYKLNDDVPQEEKQRRANEIMELQLGISAGINEEKVGQTLKVLIDRKEGQHYIGRTEFDSPEVDNEVIIDADFLRVGDFVQVKVESAGPYDLHAKPIN